MATKILLTGMGGFIASNLFHHLTHLDNEADLDVVGVYRPRPQDELAFGSYNQKGDKNRLRFRPVHIDLADHRDVDWLMCQFKPDVVFHLAGNPNVKDNDCPSTCLNSHVIPTINLLGHCKPGCRFVYASSATVYGFAGNFLEQKWTETEGPKPLCPYGASKAACEHYAHTFSRRYDFTAVSLRLVANAGPWATHGVVKDVFQKLVSDSPTLELLGDHPGSVKPILHVSDTARAFAHFGLNWDWEQGPINIAPDDEISVAEIADILMDVTGIRKLINWAGKQSVWRGDSPLVRVSNEWARNRDWTPKYPKSADAVRQAGLELLALNGGKK